MIQPFKIFVSFSPLGKTLGKTQLLNNSYDTYNPTILLCDTCVLELSMKSGYEPITSLKGDYDYVPQCESLEREDVW